MDTNTHTHATRTTKQRYRCTRDDGTAAQAVKARMQEMVEEAAAQPAVPHMESLIAQAVANSSKEQALTKQLEQALQDKRHAEMSLRKLQDDLIAEKTLHLQTAFKLIAALEDVDNLKDRNER
jgi:hypothetical protein